MGTCDRRCYVRSGEALKGAIGQSGEPSNVDSEAVEALISEASIWAV